VIVPEGGSDVYTFDVRFHTRRLLLTGCVAVWLGTAAPPLSARSPIAGQTSPPATVDAELARVTAVVTNPQGQPLRGLKPADFELLVDGIPQTIERAELVDARATPRVFAFLLDEFHIEPDGSAGVREALLDFLERHLAPADLGLVVKPLDPLTSLSPTADRESLRQAIVSFEGRKGQFEPRTDFERNYMAQAPEAVASARAQIVTSALGAVGASLSRAQTGARPVVVLVSDGFSRSRARRDIPADIQSAIRIVNRAEAPVYAFAPALVAPAADSPQPAGAFSALAALAAQTGGALSSGPDAFARGLPGMLRALDSHYVLTYRAPHGKDGRFHELKVGVRRPGAEVRATAGYLAAQPAAPRLESAAASRGPVRVLRRSPLIQTWSGFSPRGAGKGMVTVTWERATLKGTAPPRGRAMRLAVTASTPDGTTLFDSLVGPVQGPPSPDVPSAAIFEAPLGAVRLDMKVLDEKGVVLDTDSRDIRAPNTRADLPTIYPPAILRTRSAREFREVSDDPLAPPAPGRDFRRTDRLLLRVAAVDPEGNRTAVDAVLLNRLRQPMRTLPPLVALTEGNTTQFDLPLSPLAPGEYSVRLSVNGPSGVVAEYLSFRVLG